MAGEIIGDRVAFERFGEIQIRAQQSDAAVEKLKHDLKVVAVEHEVRFSKLHARRAEVIAEVYGLLVDSYIEISSFVSLVEWHGEPSKAEKYRKAMKSTVDFYRYFERNKVFLPEVICDDLEKFVDGMRAKAIGYGVYVSLPPDSATEPEAHRERRAAWNEAWTFMQTEIPPARLALERELRKILGGS